MRWISFYRQWWCGLPNSPTLRAWRRALRPHSPAWKPTIAGALVVLYPPSQVVRYLLVPITHTRDDIPGDLRHQWHGLLALTLTLSLTLWFNRWALTNTAHQTLEPIVQVQLLDLRRRWIGAECSNSEPWARSSWDKQQPPTTRHNQTSVANCR